MILPGIIADRTGASGPNLRVVRAGFCGLILAALLPALAFGRPIDLTLANDVAYRIYGARSVSFVYVELENQSDEPIEVTLRSGTKLTPSDVAFQTMAITETVVASLGPREQIVRRVPAACIAFAKALPGTSIDFQISGNVDNPELAALLGLRSVSQFAVWIVTDDITWSEVLQEHLGDESGALTDSTLAIRQLRSAGVDVTGKRLLSHPVVYWESFGALPDSASDPELARATVAATTWYTANDYLNAVADAGDPTRQLLMAADSCSLALVQLLAERGADMNARDQDGATALAIAERCPDSAIAEFLIREGASLDSNAR